jgi:hypothetical protein
MMNTQSILSTVSKIVAPKLLLLTFFVSAIGTTAVAEEGIYREYNGDGYQLSYSKRPSEPKQVIGLQGVIGFFPNISEASQTFKELDPKKEIVLNLSGYIGGSTSSAADFIQSIKDICEARRDKKDPRQSCRITTYITANSSCTSACIIAYMAGKKRVACDESKFGFHSMTFDWGVTDVQASVETNIRALSSIGVFKSWSLRNASLFKTTSVTELTPKDLVGSNIVTDIDSTCSYDQ